MLPPVKCEDASLRKIRERNTTTYRLAHWPIWIWVLFLAPGPLTFDLFATGPGRKNLAWLALVMITTGAAALSGKLPGTERGPYILRFTEDRPNPLYRRICYTFAWNAVLNFALLNLAGVLLAVITHKWRLKQIYASGYLPIFVVVLALGVVRVLPRVRASTRNEGTERRYFYGSVWAVTIAQIALFILWKTLPRTHAADLTELIVYIFLLIVVGVAAARGLLPRTRRIVPGQLMVAD